MSRIASRALGRRDFLRQTTAAVGVSALPWLAPGIVFAADGPQLMAGEGVVDVTPPLGIELAGFHRPPDKPRVATSIRQPSTVRALVLALGDVQAAIVSIDMLGVSADFARHVQAAVAEKTGIPANHVHISATHSHSMPTLKPLRQWGRVSPEYLAKVEADTLRAVQMAKDDLAPAELLLGKARSEGGNFNRTRDAWKTDRDFDAASTDGERWLDMTLTALRFRRPGRQRDLLWYHYSAHPVCYADEAAGPDWPGIVATLMQQSHGMVPSFIQGNAGDVNPGIAKGFALAKAEPTADAIHKALVAAVEAAQPVAVDRLAVVATHVDLPLDRARLADQLARYRANPAECNQGEWVDAAFSADWFAAAQKWDPSITTLRVPLAAMQLGPLGLLFHPSELYSYYGLAIRRGSPFQETLGIGYTDDFIGYIPDPEAFVAGEYAALVVPKLVDLPPYSTEAGRVLTKAAIALLNQLGGKA
ncbi:MAG TPA: neutral/alkaline non-lysosomal ceramidase N-terminal domain-containing protein [Pirellulales bacterium]